MIKYGTNNRRRASSISTFETYVIVSLVFDGMKKKRKRADKGKNLNVKMKKKNKQTEKYLCIVQRFIFCYFLSVLQKIGKKKAEAIITQNTALILLVSLFVFDVVHHFYSCTENEKKKKSISADTNNHAFIAEHFIILRPSKGQNLVH